MRWGGIPAVPAVLGFEGDTMIASVHDKGAPAACSASTRIPACPHHPRCPAAADSDRDAARTVAAHPEQGWSLLCNGVVLFDDTGELLPGGGAVPPRQAMEALFPGGWQPAMA